MARLLDDTYEMLVMAQYNIARQGGVETIEVSIIFCNDNVVLLGGRDCSPGPGRELGISAQGQPDGWLLPRASCMLFASEKAHVTLVPLVSVQHAAYAPKFG